jgi:hypothetical protein
MWLLRLISERLSIRRKLESEREVQIIEFLSPNSFAEIQLVQLELADVTGGCYESQQAHIGAATKKRELEGFSGVQWLPRKVIILHTYSALIHIQTLYNGNMEQIAGLPCRAVGRITNPAEATAEVPQGRENLQAERWLSSGRLERKFQWIGGLDRASQRNFDEATSVVARIRFDVTFASGGPDLL